MRRVLNSRPIAFFAFFFMVGIAGAYYIGLPDFFALPALCVCAGMLGLLFWKRKRQFFVALYLAAFFLGAFLFQIQFHTDFQRIVPNKPYTIEAFVSDRSNMNAKTHTYTLTDVSLESEGVQKEFGKKVILYSAQELSYGDRISFESNIVRPSAPRNPSAFDEQMYLAGKGAGFSVFNNAADVKGNRVAWYQYPFLLREKLSSNLDQIFSEQSAPIAKAMFLGVKDELPQELRDSFSKTGIAHILAISGLHIGIISYAINFLLKKLKAERRTRFSILIVLLLLYAILTGFAPSILRAVLMALFVIIGRWRFKNRDTLVFLSAALVITLLFNTAQLFGAGLLMSYGVVFGILCLNPPLMRLFHKIRLDRIKLDSALSTSLSATASVFPMTAYFFNNIALAAPLANFFAIPLAGVIVIFTGIGTLLSLVSVPAGQALAFPAELATRGLTWLNGMLAESAAGYIEVYGFPVWACVAVMAVIFLCSDYVLLKRRWKAIMAAILVCTILFAGGAAMAAGGKGMTITILDVGTGDAIHLSVDGKNYLIDNGGNPQYSKINEYAQQNGLVFDAVIETNDKTKNLKQLAEEKRIKTLYTSQQYEKKEYDIDYPVKEYGLYDKIELGENVWLEAVGSDGKYLSLALCKSGSVICLFGQTAAKDITKLNAPVLLFKPAGGGKKESMTGELLERISPQYIVFSVKKDNKKGLPDAEMTALAKGCGAAVFSTAEHGAVRILVDGQNHPEVETMK